MQVRDLEEVLGFVPQQTLNEKKATRQSVVGYIILKLLVNGLPIPKGFEDNDRLGAPRLLNTFHQRLKRLDAIHCPVDTRIETFLQWHFDRIKGCSSLKLPDLALILDRHGIARELSLPHDGDSYTNRYVSSYRVRNGVVGAPVKGATLIGDGATALKHIRGIGNDLALDSGIGNCGKAGQWVPVGVGQPTLLIGGLTVGGSAA